MNERRTREEELAEEGENVHTMPQFFTAEWVRLWPVWLLGLICVVVIVFFWVRFQG